ncbi:sugar kinase [Pullulanibacillus camelliae]|uniref:sugar kinase n=1 Tax=Pullulanibacillus camelliae TaxID=1707096 RepID=UPI001668FC5B|nr:sugar kinase [Pullulanibacillus camelliae]
MDVVSIGETMVLFTPKIQGRMRYARSFLSRIGGAETNTLIGLAKLGYQTGWISRVGMDEFGSFILSTVRGEGVDTRHVTRDQEAPTGIFFKEKINEKNVCIYYYRKHSATSCLTPYHIDEDYIGSAKYLYITGITPALSDSCRESIFYAIELAKKHDVKVAFDPNVRRKLWSNEKEARRTLLEIAKLADIVMPGISEGTFLFGTEDCEAMAEGFHEHGAKTVVIKCGEKGAYYSTPCEKGFVESYKVEQVIDPVGAGDGFAAGVLSGLLDGLTLKESVQRGCAIGAIVTTVDGDIEGLPDREMLEAFISPTEIEDVSR